MKLRTEQQTRRSHARPGIFWLKGLVLCCVFFASVQPARAALPCPPCLPGTCTQTDCNKAAQIIRDQHEENVDKIRDKIHEEFVKYGTIDLATIAAWFLNMIIGLANSVLTGLIGDLLGDAAGAIGSNNSIINFDDLPQNLQDLIPSQYVQNGEVDLSTLPASVLSDLAEEILGTDSLVIADMDPGMLADIVTAGLANGSLDISNLSQAQASGVAIDILGSGSVDVSSLSEGQRLGFLGAVYGGIQNIPTSMMPPGFFPPPVPPTVNINELPSAMQMALIAIEYGGSPIDIAGMSSPEIQNLVEGLLTYGGGSVDSLSPAALILLAEGLFGGPTIDLSALSQEQLSALVSGLFSGGNVPGYTPGGGVDEDTENTLDNLGAGLDDLEDLLEDAIGFNIENVSMGWLMDFMKEHIIRAMMMMTEQLSAVGMQQVFIFGTFLDAKQQMETHRLFRQLQAQAHKDYHPSEDFCQFGTNARSLAHSDQKGRIAAQGLNAWLIKRQAGNVSLAGALGRDTDRVARWKAFAGKYCDPSDNNGFLYKACSGGNNRDIDFTRLIDHPRTLHTSVSDSGEDAQDVKALAANLYGHDVPARILSPAILSNREYQHLYLALRAVMAKRSVALNSFSALVGMKTEGTTDVGEQGKQTRNFLGAILAELGVPNNEVYEFIGENPSYYAQLEILAKRIYQNPTFYADLYDKPSNVERKAAALKAIELMVDRAIYESQIRREMMASVLLSAQLHKPFKEVNDRLGRVEGGVR
ncbi:MAG: hypothetical protein K9G62_03360 [Alphaproteobacteria bacterium]|nr:hypothetical protein [Alphaproteobacteria bacterium]